MDLQDVYCLIDSFYVCLSLIIQKYLMIPVCPLLEIVCYFQMLSLPSFHFKHTLLSIAGGY